MLNTGCILPARVLILVAPPPSGDAQYGALLIFDEVISGFRVARGGAQEPFGVLPDITTMAKGLPAADSRSRRSAGRAA